VKETSITDKVYAMHDAEAYSRDSMAGRLLARARAYLRGYFDSFERGRSKNGIWWLVFTGALIFVVLFLVFFAIALYVFVLPGLRGPF